jgi:hypothetical protein
MSNFLPFIIAAGIVAGIVALRGGYVAHTNINDPDANYQNGSTYMDNSIFTGFFGKSGGGKKTRHRKHKRGKSIKRK